MNKIKLFCSRYKKEILVVYAVILAILFILPFTTTRRVSIDGEYTNKEEVALYLYTYHELPKNYITYHSVQTAQIHNADISKKIIGGDTFFNGGELLEYRIGKDASLKECDIYMGSYNALNKQRGTHRLVYTTNQKRMRVFYTENHYESFVELTGFGMQLARNILWIIFGVYCLIGVSIGLVIVLGKNNVQT